ncbi:HlyD family efflux transporter periplasmic adaptor subunit [Sphingomonas sp. LHG3443-2]|uniref:HlyD family efflux transporter periplasmic adaptor subunit n=1 Tax=Sphingomonas sp. LHG3443-2 TaxID=2804639 RepID=UPI003CE9E6D7
MNFRLRQSTQIILLSAFAVAAFVLWSLWAEIDQVSRARGQVIPSGRTQVVQSEDGGTIAEILVSEGDRVKRGDLLVRLDETRPRAAVEESEAQVAALKARMARIQAELFNRPLVFPAETRTHPEFVASQRELYTRRRQALSSQIQSLQAMLSLTRQELDMNLPLVDSGDVSRSEVLRMQRQTSDLQGQINTRRSEYLAELQTEYAKTEEELASATEQLTQRSAILRGSELRSPTDGVIVAIKYNTVGGVLRAGDEVLQLVPTGDKLVVEARVSPTDIAFIRQGQTANVKFDAYDSSIYGSADGIVTHISADTLSEETKEGVQTYYRVLLSADPAKLRPRHEGEKIVLQPGMTSVAEIITGQTTVFKYLTKPILKTTGDSLGER